MIWAEIARTSQTTRFETLSAELAACGIDQRFESFALAGLSLQDQWPLIAEKNFAQLRIDLSQSLSAEDIPVEIPGQVNSLKCADAFVKDLSLEAGSRAKTWIARNFFFEAIVELMAQRVRDLDFTGDVLIIGSGCEARVLSFALSQVGFRRLTIASRDAAQASALVTNLKRSCFGVEFSQIPLVGLTQLAATQSVAVNTLDLLPDSALINELSYFNFIKPHGVWIETSTSSAASPLVEEANELSLQTVSALDVMTLVDALWAKACFGVGIDRARYRKTWSEKIISD